MKVVAAQGRRMKSLSPGNIINSLSVLPPAPPIHNNTLRRRPKMTTNLTVTWTEKCQRCPDPFPPVNVDEA